MHRGKSCYKMGLPSIQGACDGLGLITADCATCIEVEEMGPQLLISSRKPFSLSTSPGISSSYKEV